MTDVKAMQVGQIVDFCVAYNDRQKQAEKREKHIEQHSQKRRASQGDINAFFG